MAKFLMSRMGKSAESCNTSTRGEDIEAQSLNRKAVL